MKRFLLALLVACVLVVPASLIGEALDFGGLAWLATLLVVVSLAGLVDRPGFYGTQRRPHSR
jgi:hypothetical protein